ncbi:MAG: ABC transporter substrate-binding protein [Caldilineaceae bacterium]
MNIYHFLLEPPLFMYMWADPDMAPVGGESWEWVDDTTIRVKLPEGAVWSDGNTFTSKDVVDTFAIRRLLNTVEWADHLVDVVAVDDNTVDFPDQGTIHTAPRRLLRDVYIRSSATYGEWADRVPSWWMRQDHRRPGMEGSDQEFTQFRPEDMVVLGPFKIDPASITESQMNLNKVPTSFMAENVKFDRIVNFNGETPTITPLVLAGDIDYATHGFRPPRRRNISPRASAFCVRRTSAGLRSTSTTTCTRLR